MKKPVFLFFMTLSAVSCAQQNYSSLDKVRLQGYLFIQTSIGSEQQDFSNKKISFSVDNPTWTFFEAMNSNDSSFAEIIKSFETPNDSVLYLPMALTASKLDLDFTTFSLKKFLKNEELGVSLINEALNFKNKEKTTIRVINDPVIKRVYQVVYIDGIWEKIKIPFKLKENIPTGNYKTSHLAINHKQGYTYYFLNKLIAISYDLSFEDVTIEQLKSSK